MQNVLFLRSRQGQFLDDRPGQAGAFLGVTDAAVGGVLVRAADVVQQGRNPDHIEIRLLSGSNAVAKAINPAGVVPVMAATRTGEKSRGRRPHDRDRIPGCAAMPGENPFGLRRDWRSLFFVTIKHGES